MRSKSITSSLQTWKLKRFRIFLGNVSAFFRSVSSVFPTFFRNDTVKTPETDRKKRKLFPKKKRNLLSFQVCLKNILIRSKLRPTFLRAPKTHLVRKQVLRGAICAQLWRLVRQLLLRTDRQSNLQSSSLIKKYIFLI